MAHRTIVEKLLKTKRMYKQKINKTAKLHKYWQK